MDLNESRLLSARTKRRATMMIMVAASRSSRHHRRMITSTIFVVWAAFVAHWNNLPIMINGFFLAPSPFCSSSISSSCRRAPSDAAQLHTRRISCHFSETLLSMAASSPSSSSSLKTAAQPLMAAGQRLALWGEAWIDATRGTEQYGGPLSNAGANVRNAGDHISQAAASCRFKTGTELIAEELREAGTALEAAADCLQQAVLEDNNNNNNNDSSGKTTTTTTTNLYCGGLLVEHMIGPIRTCSRSLEASGAAVLHRQPAHIVGGHLEQAGRALATLGNNNSSSENDDDHHRSNSAVVVTDEISSRMILAGCNLQQKSMVSKPVGSNWMKPSGR